MRAKNYTITFEVNQAPAEVIAAIINVRAWWTGEIEGSADRVGDSFTYRYEDIHRSTQRVTEILPERRVVWHVDDAQLNFVADKTEWIGTDIVFDVWRKGDRTQVTFTHVGLVPDFECYNDCSNAWGGYINGGLRNAIESARTKAA